MALEPGTRIGTFEVVDRLGEGGMGEVYRARDTRLDREIALKVLPELFSQDAERVARFEREARVLAQLNHPNIAQVYGFEPSTPTGHSAIAMELVEGPTLEDVIRDHHADTGAGLPLDRALAIARQIAIALEVAHEQGIVHRDLKPANIKVRDDGTVKVLDFGLAKAFAPETDGPSSVSNSPTITARSTQLGMIIGTAAYMSPEQAKARPVDRRADVWAFGAVLFEMLAARRAFEGDDVSDVLASVLKTEPDWTLLPADLPAPVRRLLRRCLEKDPKKRLRDIGEGMLQLDEGLASGSTTSGVTVSDVRAAGPERRTFWLAIAGTAVATALIAGAIGAWRAPVPERPAVARAVHVADDAAPMFLAISHRDIAISPDGRFIAYSAGAQGAPSEIHLRPLDQLEGAPVRGARPALGPFFSPDSRWIGFVDQVDQTQLKKVSVLGGPPVDLTKARTPVFGAAWLPDGIVFGTRGGPLFSVGDGGGEPAPVTSLADGDTTHAWPAAVPGTQVVLFSASATVSGLDGQLAAVDRRSGRTVKLNVAGFHPRYLSTGHIVYATSDGSVRAVAFDPARMEVTGTPAPVIDSVGVKASGAANFDVSTGGHLVYSGGGVMGAERTIVWVDRAGRETPTGVPERNYFYVRISPDGSRLSLDARDEEQDIWIWDLARESLSRLTDRPGPDQYGLWTPDRRIVFSSVMGGRSELFHHREDGVGQAEQITDTSVSKLLPFPNAVTPDGKRVILRAAVSGTALSDLYTAEIGGDRAITPLLATEHDERNAALSPRGDYMVFESNLSGGRYEIFVRPFPDVDRFQRNVSTAGGEEPVWSPDGREIFYIQGNRMMAVPVQISPDGLDLKKPVPLFDVSLYFFGGLGRNYDIAPDGRRFAMVKRVREQENGPQPITIVLNWIEELRARVK